MWQQGMSFECHDAMLRHAIPGDTLSTTGAGFLAFLDSRERN